jgi:hypothetical protein
MITLCSVALGRHLFGLSFSMLHFLIATPFNCMVPSQIGRDIRHRRIGGSAFQTPYLTHIIKKIKQERDISQGLRRTSMIKKHGKNT